MPRAVTLKKLVERFCEDLQDLLELTPKKDVLFIIGDWNANRKSRNTWSNRQILPWSTERSRAKANRFLPRESTGHSKHHLPTTQEKTLLHGHHQMVNTEIKFIIFFAAKHGEALYSQQKPDQELTVTQIMNSLFRLKIQTPNSDLN